MIAIGTRLCRSASCRSAPGAAARRGSSPPMSVRTPCRPRPNSSRISGRRMPKAVRSSSSTALSPNSTTSAKAGPSPTMSRSHERPDARRATTSRRLVAASADQPPGPTVAGCGSGRSRVVPVLLDRRRRGRRLRLADVGRPGWARRCRGASRPTAARGRGAGTAGRRGPPGMIEQDEQHAEPVTRKRQSAAGTSRCHEQVEGAEQRAGDRADAADHRHGEHGEVLARLVGALAVGLLVGTRQAAGEGGERAGEGEGGELGPHRADAVGLAPRSFSRRAISTRPVRLRRMPRRATTTRIERDEGRRSTCASASRCRSGPSSGLRLDPARSGPSRRTGRLSRYDVVASAKANVVTAR